jgi:RNA polymerase sigma-70 factor (ECF subfamily)
MVTSFGLTNEALARAEIKTQKMSDFTDIYRRYAPDVYRFALYLTGNRSDAEDITSETFARLWASSEPIRSQTVKGYLCTIARNLFLQGLRRQSRRAELPDHLPDMGAGPEERTEQKLELERVMAQLQKLPETDRAALLMRALEDLPYEEIAVALNIPVSTAKVKVHRARLTLALAKDS